MLAHEHQLSILSEYPVVIRIVKGARKSVVYPESKLTSILVIRELKAGNGYIPYAVDRYGLAGIPLIFEDA